MPSPLDGQKISLFAQMLIQSYNEYFKEELQMLAQNDEYLQEAAASIRIANEAEIVREQCRAREDALRRERTLERDNNRLLAENASQQEQIASQQEQIASLRKQLAELQAQIIK